MHTTGKSGQLENTGYGKIPQQARKLITKIKEKNPNFPDPPKSAQDLDMFKSNFVGKNYYD